MTTKQRNSSIELLKIVAIALIVINHVTMSINKVPELGIRIASPDINVIVLTCFRHFGAIGNTIFMVCSSWFLVDNNRVDGKKVFRLISDVWIISVLILGIVWLGGVIKPNVTEIIKSFFPTTFSNNWYITCYVMIYAAHGVLNRLINGVPQKTLLLLTFILVVMYCGLGTLSVSLLFYTRLMLFISIYLLVGYMKKYIPSFCSNMRTNTRMFFASIMVLLGLILITNVLGLHIGLLRTKTLA